MSDEVLREPLRSERIDWMRSACEADVTEGIGSPCVENVADAHVIEWEHAGNAWHGLAMGREPDGAWLHARESAGAAHDAVTTLECLREAAIAHRHPALAVRSTIALAGALFAMGYGERAGGELLKVLHQGADTGLCRTFLDAMPPIEPILRDLRRRSADEHLGHSAAYIGSLLAHDCASTPTPAPVCLSSRHRPATMVDLLSSRETMVLRLIGLGLSNKYIGRELSIAPETVKSHVKNIFVKLATKTRAEAVSRAVERGLL